MDRSNPDTDIDLIELDLPLRNRHSSTVRALSASIAADAGFSVDDIDDFRLGVNEAVALLTDVDAGPDARLHITFEAHRSLVRVVASRRGVDELLDASDLDELARRILTAVLDGFRIEDGSFIVEKRATAHVD